GSPRRRSTRFRARRDRSVEIAKRALGQSFIGRAFCVVGRCGLVEPVGGNQHRVAASRGRSATSEGGFSMEFRPEACRQAYQDDGFVVVPELLEPALLARLREGMDDITG